jgi:hypothetical protein
MIGAQSGLYFFASPKFSTLMRSQMPLERKWLRLPIQNGHVKPLVTSNHCLDREQFGGTLLVLPAKIGNDLRVLRKLDNSIGKLLAIAWNNTLIDCGAPEKFCDAFDPVCHNRLCRRHRFQNHIWHPLPA